MATTYARIQTTLRQASQQDEWESTEALARHIRRRRLRDFKVRGDGSSADHYMNEDSVTNLIDLMIELELLEKKDADRLKLSRKGKTCLVSEENLNLRIRSSVKSVLQEGGLPMDIILEEIKKIKLPNVPDADTIFEQLKAREHRISIDLLRKLLFLHHCSDGISRKVRVHYEAG